MTNTTISATISRLSEKAALFENDGEQDRFLIDAVTAIRNTVGAAATAIFLYDPESKELVFRAGLDEEGLWDRLRCEATDAPLRFSLDGTAVGDAFREGRIVRWEYGEGEADNAIRSKMIVPIAHGPIHIGVLILADSRSEAFVDCEDGHLLAVAARVGDLIAEGSLLVGRPTSARTTMQRIGGHRASEGVAIGRALPFWSENRPDSRIVPRATSEEELERFDRAVAFSLEQLEALLGENSPIADVGALIFQAHVLMLRDPSFTGRMRERIAENASAVDAIRGVVGEYVELFAGMQEQRLAEKAQDVRDLGNRLVVNLQDSSADGFSYKGRIVLARHVYPSDLARLAVEQVAGVVLLGTAVTAHISILARSLDIPVLITDDRSLLRIEYDTELLLDADGGTLIVRPSEEVLAEYRSRGERVTATPGGYTLAGSTADGYKITVAANVNILKDAEDARRRGSEGIGLYRSEFPFILKDDFLSEEQQYSIYRAIVETHHGKQVDLRTADIGGDKLLQGRSTVEDNPFLGVRGIRFSLANREMFRDQLRAMLRAGAGADLGIMLPMVSGVEEVIEARKEIEHAASDLAARGVPHNGRPRVGAMIELPSAALAVEELAQVCDFLSIGTNDLTMYLLAVDRTNEALSSLYRTYHPAVLHILERIAESAGELRGRLSVCGEAAADPVLMLFFVGIGITKLSVSPSRIESVKARLASYSREEAQAIARDLLSIRRIAEMEEYLRRFDGEGV